jgi:hypothetical protein
MGVNLCTIMPIPPGKSHPCTPSSKGPLITVPWLITSLKSRIPEEQDTSDSVKDLVRKKKKPSQPEARELSEVALSFKATVIAAREAKMSVNVKGLKEKITQLRDQVNYRLSRSKRMPGDNEDFMKLLLRNCNIALEDFTDARLDSFWIHKDLREPSQKTNDDHGSKSPATLANPGASREIDFSQIIVDMKLLAKDATSMRTRHPNEARSTAKIQEGSQAKKRNKFHQDYSNQMTRLKKHLYEQTPLGSLIEAEASKPH